MSNTESSKELRSVASVVRNDPGEPIILADIVARPLRLAFLLHTSLAYDKLCSFLAYLSSIWGGCYSLCVPTDGTSIAEEWWRNLYVQRPDIVWVITDAEHPVQTDLTDELRRCLQPFTCEIMSVWPLGRRGPSGDPRWDQIGHAVTIFQPLVHELSRLQGRPTAELRGFSFPQIGRDHPLFVHVACSIGIAEGRYPDILKASLSAREISVEGDDFRECMRAVSALHRSVNPLRLTALSLRVGTSMGEGYTTYSGGLEVVCYGSSPVEGACILRALYMASVPTFNRKATLLAIPGIWHSRREIVDAIAEMATSGETASSGKITIWSSPRLDEGVAQFSSVSQSGVKR